MNILVVDDDRTTREMFSELLSKNGHVATTVGSGYDAIDSIRNSMFDLAIVDLKMPGIDGIEVLKRIKTIKPSTHVIIVTAYGTVDTVVKAFKMGAVDFIRKPFKLKKIQDIINKVNTESLIEKEQKSIEDKKKAVKNGNNLEFTYDLLLDSITTGKGLLVTSRDPSDIKKTHNLGGIEVIELKPAGNNKTYSNSDLVKIKDQVLDFIKSHERSIVLIDGFEFLIQNFSWDSLKVSIKDIFNELYKSNSRLIIYTSSEDLQEVDMVNLKQIIYEETINTGLNCSANSIEIDILEYLFSHKESTFNKIFKNLNIKQSSKLSFHLQKLLNNGIIKKENRIYSLESKGEIILRGLRYFDTIDVEDYQIPISIIFEHK